MEETSTPAEVAALLQSSHSKAPSGIIGIDGADGVGKTTLAKAIYETVGGTTVSVDDFLLETQGVYVPSLCLYALRQVLATADRPIIIEGVCLLLVLRKLSRKPDVLIYVKRISDGGYWPDEDVCDPKEPEKELIERLSREARGRLSPFREEVIRYHYRFRPSRRADIVYLVQAAVE